MRKPKPGLTFANLGALLVAGYLVHSGRAGNARQHHNQHTPKMGQASGARAAGWQWGAPGQGHGGGCGCCSESDGAAGGSIRATTDPRLLWKGHRVPPTPDLEHRHQYDAGGHCSCVGALITPMPPTPWPSKAVASPEEVGRAVDTWIRGHTQGSLGSRSCQGRKGAGCVTASIMANTTGAGLLQGLEWFPRRPPHPS